MSALTLVVQVTPNARRSEFAGWSLDEQNRPLLLVRLQAPPQDGRANEELVRFLAEALGCRKAEIRLVRGTSARRKQLELPAACAERLPAR
jgi:uncharacterized protein